MVDDVFEPAVVVTVNVTELLPAGTVAVGGTPALLGLLLATFTTIPPTGALPLNMTVPVEFEPATTAVGFSVREDSTGSFTVSVVVLFAPL